MPLNFPKSRKVLMVILLAIITFMTPFASSILASAIGAISDEFDESDIVLAAMPVSIFLLGYAVGPLFLSPLSEIYGRYYVLVIANAYFCVWLIGCALATSLDTLIFFRFMCGVGGAACQTIGGAIIADLFPVEERGMAISIWMIGPMFGPSLAPMIGGFVVESIGWRWVSWITFIPATAAAIGLAIFSTETNHHVLIQRKTDRLRKELNRPELRSCYVDPDKPVLSHKQILFLGLTRPLKMLFRSAIIFSVSLYIAFAYGCLYLLFNTIPIVFREAYGWSLGITGLIYLTVLVGYAIGLALFTYLSDSTVVRMTKANNGVYEPEMRLPDSIYFGILIPITFFWYGWSADQRVHWIVPALGLVPFSVGVVGIWLPIQAYIVDAYPTYAASGLAAFMVLRSTVAAFLPLAGPDMYESLGVGWGTSLLGFIAVALIPIPAVIFKYGKRMRERYPLNL
ncbi:major facilitator superfamily domain-containing protein [Stachybotrys elegans]|uniref:Major facilitator superfamily domain-containing protein n=1 Tax=Stachybotrys elegans TaxID=80388 RepID=A0A8K0WXN7_9HYPO|nr:major facilitator superfamily domain-containing protein [Stachybotrys elegans]